MINSPTDIDNCIIWLDASDTTTLSSFSGVDVDPFFNKTAGDLVDGDKIGFWGNKVSDQYHFLNSFGDLGNRPIYHANFQALNFTSQDETYLTADTDIIIDSQTVFVVTMPRDCVQGNRIYTQNFENTNDFSGVSGLDGFMPITQSDFNGEIGTWSEGGYRSQVTTTFEKGKFLIFRHRNTGTQIQNAVGTRSQVTYNLNAPLSSTNIKKTRLGARLNSDNSTTGNQVFFDGYIREIIAYDRSLTDSECTDIINYFQAKWDFNQHQENAIFALQNGNWNSINWSTGSQPNFSTDTIYCNGFTVDVNSATGPLSAHILTNRFGGGSFRLFDTVSLSAMLILGGGGDNPSGTALIQTVYSVGNNSNNTVVSTLCARTGIRTLSNGDNGILNLYGSFIGCEKVLRDRDNGALQNRRDGTLNIYGDIFNRPGSARAKGLFQPSTGGPRGFINMVGDVYGGGTLPPTDGTIEDNQNREGMILNEAIGFSFSGNVYAGMSTGIAAFNLFRGFITINGNISGAPHDLPTLNLTNNNVPVIINGDVLGGQGQSGCIRVNIHVSPITINGTVSGGYVGRGAIQIAGNEAIFCNGIVKAGWGANGIWSSQFFGDPTITNGIVYVRRAVGSDAGLGTMGYVETYATEAVGGNFPFAVQQFEVGSKGMFPCRAHVYSDIVTDSQFFLISSFVNSQGVRFYSDPPISLFSTATAVNGNTLLPSVSDVRLGTVFDLGTKIGTIILPNPAVVLDTEPLDDSFGSAVFTSDAIWQVPALSAKSFTNRIGERLYYAINIDESGNLLTFLK